MMSPFEVIKVRSTKIIVSVECLKAGQKACTGDKNGNIGTGNKGKHNFGHNNEGNINIGVPTDLQEGVSPAATQERIPPTSQKGAPANPQEGAPATPSRWITSSTNTLLPFTSSPYLFPFAFPSLSPSSLASSSLASSLASSSLASSPISSSLASSPITSQPSSSPVSSPTSSSVIPTSPRCSNSDALYVRWVVHLPPLPLDVCHTQSEEDRIRNRQGGRRL
ncbi:hypothetical protein ACKKBG_A10325 [Auxenochlorella protothecoides x Auxenochlorella symbiontica]